MDPLITELGLTVIQSFPSKKNKVHLTRRGNERFVLKIFSPEFAARASREFWITKEAAKKHLDVPAPLTLCEGRAILFSFVPGHNLCDRLNENPLPVFAPLLARWYARWHSAMKSPTGTLVKGDSHLRNFLIDSSTIYGLDFEEAHAGDAAQDIGEICSSILATDPMFTRTKVELCKNLIKDYLDLSHYSLREKIIEYTAEALEAAALRRPGQCSYLKTKAALIKGHGLTHHLAEL